MTLFSPASCPEHERYNGLCQRCIDASGLSAAAPVPLCPDSETLTSDDVAKIENANQRLLSGLTNRTDDLASDGRRIIGTVRRLCATVRHLESERTALAADLGRLREERDGLRRDAERLDFLEAHLADPLTAMIGPRADGNGYLVIQLKCGLRDAMHAADSWPIPWTLREAIDAASLAEQEGTSR